MSVSSKSEDEILSDIISFLKNEQKEQVANSQSISRNHPYFDPKVLKEFSDKGSATAKRFQKSQQLFYQSITILRSGKIDDLATCINSLSQAFQVESLCCQLRQEDVTSLSKLTNQIMSENKTCDLDLNARICNMHLRLMTGCDLINILDILNVSLTRYPDNIALLKLRGTFYVMQKKFSNGLSDFEKILKLNPTHYETVFYKAGLLSQMGSDHKTKSMDAYKLYLKLAPKDDRVVPEVYYALAFSDRDNLKSWFQKGCDSEKAQLPYFLPYKSPKKEFLELLSQLSGGEKSVVKKEEKKAEEQQQKVPEQKPKPQASNSRALLAKDTKRTNVILGHREYFSHCNAVKNYTQLMMTAAPDKIQDSTMTSNMAKLKPLFLKDVLKIQDKIFKDHILNLTSLETVIVGNNGASTVLVVQDDNGTVERLCIYNLSELTKRKIGNKEIFAPGFRLAVIDPYIRMAVDRKHVIRIDDPNKIVYLGQNVMGMCRLCGQPDSKSKCSKCDAVYCCNECQMDDMKRLKHNLICS
jgi:tetratricopeptide (TPR) repeat protein